MSVKKEVQTNTVSLTSLWHNRDFVLLESGQTISSLGSNISGLAFLLLILALTHSPAQAGLIVALKSLPFLILALPAGAWVDRWNRKWVIILCDTGRALSLASIAIAAAIGHLTIVQLAINALIEGTLFTFFNICITASVPRVVPKQQLTQATGVDYVANQTVALFGVPIGTFLFGIAQVFPFLIDAVSYIVSVISMFWIRSEFQQTRLQTKRHLLQEIAEGFTMMWKQPILRYQAFAGLGLNFVFSTNILIVTLLAQKQHAPNTIIGLIFAIGSIGGILGSLIANRIGMRFSFGQVMIGMFFLLALIWLLYAIAPNPLVLGIITAGILIVEPIGSIVNIGYRLALTSDEFQGRVTSVHRLGNGIGTLLGPICAGLLLQYAGTTWTVIFFFGVLFAFTISTLLYAPVRNAPRLD